MGEVHYVCPECRGVSDHPQLCETVGCDRLGMQLVECKCEDGKHEGI